MNTTKTFDLMFNPPGPTSCKRGATLHRNVLAVLLTVTLSTLSACSTVQPVPTSLQSPQAVPAHWTASLPHEGQAVELARWWKQQGEAELVELQDDAQRASPTVATALARIDQAKATQAQARASVLPEISAATSAVLTRTPLQSPALTQIQAGLNWELDLAGLRDASTAAAQAQHDSAQAQWHEARVLVAAEVATLYHGLRSCQQQVLLLEADAGSREETARLTHLMARAGLRTPSFQAETEAAAAQARSRLLLQRATCDTQLQTLVALTGRDVASLRTLLAPTWQRTARTTPFAIAAVPAQTLTQRPDVYSAERDVLQAQAQRIQAEASRLPRLSLQGFVGPGHFRSGTLDVTEPTWTVGPLSVTLPLFDAGQRAAREQAAATQVRAAMVAYQARVRQAVREVEDALLQLDTTERRWTEASNAAAQAHRIRASQARALDQGLISQLDWQDAQRQVWSAESAVLELDLQRHLAWITLYRAAGGGFQATQAL